MKGKRMWFTTGMGIVTILCTVAIAPAPAGPVQTAARAGCDAVSGDDDDDTLSHDPLAPAGCSHSHAVVSSGTTLKKAASELIDSLFRRATTADVRRAYTNNEASRRGDLVDSAPAARRVEITVSPPGQ